MQTSNLASSPSATKSWRRGRPPKTDAKTPKERKQTYLKRQKQKLENQQSKITELEQTVANQQKTIGEQHEQIMGDQKTKGNILSNLLR